MAELIISVLDVGHGDFIYATTPLGNNLVIDCGAGDDVQPGTFLSKVTTISELQITHPHTDHFRDIVSLSKKQILSFRCPNLDRFSDDVIGWKYSDKAATKQLREMKAALKADDNAVVCGQGFSHSVYYPSNIDYKDPNSISAVTILSYNGFKLLSGGDLPKEGWIDMLRKPDFVSAIKGTTVLKASHHGREVGYCEELFEHISPLLCIVSDKNIDDSNENTEVTEWYRNKCSGVNVVGSTERRKVLTTRCDGSIFLRVESAQWWVYPNTRWRT